MAKFDVPMKFKKVKLAVYFQSYMLLKFCSIYVLVGSIEQEHSGISTTQEIVDHITNTMTDRHVVNKKANQLLQSKKSAANQEDWNNFFCSVHPLDSFAKCADKVLKSFETNFSFKSKSFTHRSGSMTVGLIFAVSKLFHKEGAGVPVEIKSYISSLGFPSNLIEYHVGQRFHILFHNGGAVYVLAPHIMNFFSKVWGTPNRLLQAINADLQQAELLDGCRALGLIGKQVTGPWLKQTMADQPILHLNAFFKDTFEKLERWSDDAGELMVGEGVLFGEERATPDNILKELIKPNQRDALVKQLVQGLCGEILQVGKRQLADQLPGGEFWEPTDAIKAQAESCTSNNISGERIFAKLDSSIRRAPSAKMDFHEARIMFQSNKSSAWLDAKPENEQKHIISTARRLVKGEMVKSKEKQKLIHIEKLAQLKAKQIEISKKQDRQREFNENILEDLYKIGGLWQTKVQLEDNLAKITSESKKKLALKTQIKARKIFIKQTHNDSDIFSFSSNGKPLNARQLQSNILKLMEKPITDDDDDKIKMCIEDPDILVNIYISHKWLCDSGEEKSFEGQIIDKVNSNGIVEFKIVYFDHDDNFVYLQYDELLTDIHSGDLTVLW